MIHLKGLLARLVLALLLYTVCRVLFLALNIADFRNLPGSEIFAAFVLGLRFDIAAICVTNSGLIILSLLPGPLQDRPWYQRFLKFVFLGVNIPFLILNVVDLEYYKFTGQRSTLMVFDMKADLPVQLVQLFFHYWYLGAIAGLLIFVLCYFQPRPQPTPKIWWGKSAWWAWGNGLLIIVAVLPLSVLGGRGGWQQKPLVPAHAHAFNSSALAYLALDSSYTLLRSRDSCDPKSLPRVRYFHTDAELEREFSPKTPAVKPRDARHDNVVIIIVESLSSEFTGLGNSHRGYTPFLDSLAGRGLYFKNNFAAARRSIDSLLPILAGIPYLSNSTFVCSLTRDIHGIGSLLKDQGYQTSFFHGGLNGTMYFDVLAKRVGLDRYFGLFEYPNPADSDGHWGIYDEPFLQFTAQKLTESKQPFAAVIFTLSSHNPYKIPPQYQGVFPKGPLPIHESIGYVDHSLKRFFEAAEKTSWYQNTLFIITGDHTERSQRRYQNLVDTYRVPLIFFHPSRKLPSVNPARITQHTDITPSVIDFLGIATNKTLTVGHSVFDSSFDGLAVSQKDGTYWLVHESYYLKYRIGAPSQLFDLATDDALTSPIADKHEVQERLERKLKAYIQRFNNGLLENNLH